MTRTERERVKGTSRGEGIACGGWVVLRWRGGYFRNAGSQEWAGVDLTPAVFRFRGKSTRRTGRVRSGSGTCSLTATHVDACAGYRRGTDGSGRTGFTLKMAMVTISDELFGRSGLQSSRETHADRNDDE